MTEFGVEVALIWGAIAAYIAGFALLAHAVVFSHPERVRWGRWPLLAGLAPHAAAIVMRWVAVGHGPYMLKYEVLSANVWLALAALLAFIWRRPAWTAAGLFVVPTCILGLALGVFSNPEARELPPTLRSTWLVFHVTFAKLAAAAFLLATGIAGLVVVRSRRSPPRWAQRLPDIAIMDANEVRLVGFGFIFWTVAVLAGAIWANISWGRYWGWDAVETWSLITWLVYGSFLHTRLFFRPGPRASAWMAIGAFVVFVLTIAILPFLIPSLHSAYFQ